MYSKRQVFFKSQELVRVKDSAKLKVTFLTPSAKHHKSWR